MEAVRSSRSQMFFKIGVLKNFANFTGKQLNNPVKFAHFSRTLFFDRTPPVVASELLSLRFLPVFKIYKEGLTD